MYKKRQSSLFMLIYKYRKGDFMEALIFNDPNFSEETIRIINLYKPLAQWFKKNQFALTYYGFTKPNFDFDEQTHHSPITGILKKMADTSLTWIETKYPYSDIDKALKAAAAIFNIYMAHIREIRDYIEYCNSVGKTCDIDYDIVLNMADDPYTERFDSDFMSDVLTPPDLVDFELAHLEQKRAALTQQLTEVDERICVLQNARPKK